MGEPQAIDYDALAKQHGAIASTPPAGIPRDARGMPAVSSDTSDAPSSPLLAALGPLAHPETLVDFARLLTLPVDAVRRAYASALTMAAARPAAAAVGSAVRSAPGAVVRGAVNGTAAVGDVVDPAVIGVASPRVGKVVELAQKMRDARASAAPAQAAAATVTPAAATVAPVAPPVMRPGMSPQQLLNEQAIAARRAAVQTPAPPAAAAAEVAPVAKAPLLFTPKAAAPPAEPIVAASGKMQLTAPEMKQFTRLVQKGVTLPDALEAVKAMRDLASRLGGATDAEVAKVIAARGYKG